MSKHILTKELNNARQKFSAVFNCYEFQTFQNKGENKIHFTNLRDENNNLLKESFYVDGNREARLISYLCPTKRIDFTATMEIDESNSNEFKLKDLDLISYNN